MHYYSRNIPAYALDTAHLTMIEDGAYNRLIDMYYTQEAPIALDLPKLFRVLRARSEEEQTAVKVVLDEFFTKTPEGYTHKRCNIEIAAYHDKAAINRANGAKGGRPRKQEAQPAEAAPAPQAQPETQSVISGLPEITLTGNRKPETVNQEPETEKAPDGAAPPAAQDDDVSAKPARFSASKWLKARGISQKLIDGVLAARKTKRLANTEIAFEGIESEGAKLGWTLEATLTRMALDGWGSFKAQWVENDRRTGQRGEVALVATDPAGGEVVSEAQRVTRATYDAVMAQRRAAA